MRGYVEREKGPFDILKNASQTCASRRDGTRGRKREIRHPIGIDLLSDRAAVEKGQQNGSGTMKRNDPARLEL